jgi:hypothetical protein
MTNEQLFAIASGRASEIQVIEHEPAPGTRYRIMM